MPVYGIILTTLGVTLLDFSADSCDSPLRAYILDVCNSRDKDTAFNIHAFLGGMGAALGYILTSIEWNKTFFGQFADETQILFTISAVIFLLCLFSTITSAREDTIQIEIENDDKISVYQEIKIMFSSFLNVSLNFLSNI